MWFDRRVRGGGRRAGRRRGGNMAAVVSEVGAREAAPGCVCCRARSASMTVYAGIS